MPNETPLQILARWKAETPLRAQQFNASLPSRDASELQAGEFGFGLSVQDIANRGSDGRY